jgi:hypothetical protein
MLRPPRGNRCRVHESWPAFKHFAEQVVVSRWWTQDGAEAHGADIQDAVRGARGRWLALHCSRGKHRYFLALWQTKAVIEHDNAIVNMTTNNH